MHNEFTVPHNVFEDDQFIKMSHTAKFLYCYLAKARNRYGRSNDRGEFWHSETQIERGTGICAKTIRRAKKELVMNGFLSIQRGRYDYSKQRAPDWFFLEGYHEDLGTKMNANRHDRYR